MDLRVPWSSGRRSGTWRTRGLLTAWYTRDAASGYSVARVPAALLRGERRPTTSRCSRRSAATGASGRRGPGTRCCRWSVDGQRREQLQHGVPALVPAHQQGDRADDHGHPAAALRVAQQPRGALHDRAGAVLALPRHRVVDDAGAAAVLRRQRLPPEPHDRAVPVLRAPRSATPSRRTTWVSPFFYSHTHARPTPPRSASRWCSCRSTGTSSAATIATTLVLPLYAHWQRPGYRSTLVIPIYYYQEGLRDDGTPDGTYRRFVGVVLPFYDSGVKRPGDFMWNILGGLVGRRAHRPPPLPAPVLVLQLRDRTRAARPDRLVQQPARARRARWPRAGLNVVGF